uniref:Homologous recombination OB-fold protein OB-fold domain-containing protein n=1 Tax=Tanacetum cinerariifolium TaxID=118510 RepID=A0A6L2J4Y3_TANCI|nr:hypothetical protein [Tanacetum cinerariifolium]
MAADHGFVHLEELRFLANSGKLRDQLLVYFDIKTQREVQLATEFNNLMGQLVESTDKRHSFIQELEHLPGNVMAYKTREELKGLQKDELIKAMKMRTIALPLHFRPSRGLTFLNLRWRGICNVYTRVIRKVIEDVGEDDDFTRAPWLSVLDYVNVDRGIVTGCFGNVKKLLKNGKLERVVAVIKSCTSNVLGDLIITLKNLLGTISGTIYYKVFTEESFAKAIIIGAALILHNVSVLSPKQSTHHYLNITKKNMVKVFHMDRGSA